MNLNTILTIVIIILAVVLAILAVLYYFGRKMQKRQEEQKALLDASKQTVSMLIIDKKKVKIKDSKLPKQVYEQTPAYLRWTKLPVVTAKVGPKIAQLIADDKVYEQLPVKAEVKVVISGIYISELKSVRGGSVVKPAEKKGFFARFRK